MIPLRRAPAAVGNTRAPHRPAQVTRSAPAPRRTVAPRPIARGGPPAASAAPASAAGDFIKGATGGILPQIPGASDMVGGAVGGVVAQLLPVLKIAAGCAGLLATGGALIYVATRQGPAVRLARVGATAAIGAATGGVSTAAKAARTAAAPKASAGAGSGPLRRAATPSPAPAAKPALTEFQKRDLRNAAARANMTPDQRAAKERTLARREREAA